MCRKSWFLTVCGVMLMCACSGGEYADRQLVEALELAGDNRWELERVLEHYRGDSLKLEAAKFLIRNMPGHYSYADTLRANRYYDAVDSMFDAFHGQSMDSIRIEINDLARELDVSSIGKVHDAQIITADFLIRNIDEAFLQWRQTPWCAHLTFDEFCEYILPYKSEELQPLDHWREDFSDLWKDELELLKYADLFRHSSFRAATVVRDKMYEKYRPMLAESVEVPVMRTSTRLRIPFGMCEDYVSRTTPVLRSIGIPVVMEFTPQWSYGDNAHDWNIVLTRKGWEVPFAGIMSSPGEQHKPFENLPKAYRRTYAQNPEIRDINRTEEYVPPFFRNIFLKDVTANHTSVVTLDIPVKGENDGFAYLTVSSGTEWKVVGYGIVKDGKAKFENVGRECIYLPVRYDGNGHQRAISSPLRVTSTGDVTPLTGNLESCETVVLHRKYPVLEYVYVQALKMMGGRFEASNKADFSDAVTVGVVENPSSEGRVIVVPDSVGRFRYWRYVNTQEGNNASVAEIAFLDKNGLRMNGEIIGSAPWGEDSSNAVANAFDGQLLTNFNAAVSAGGWVGMDFGEPDSVKGIRYYSRGDGNSIEPGDHYELLRWDTGGGKWIAVGSKQANGETIQFDKVPKGALLLLRDRTKGHNEHVFIYEGNEQHWW